MRMTTKDSHKKGDLEHEMESGFTSSVNHNSFRLNSIESKQSKEGDTTIDESIEQRPVMQTRVNIT